VTILTGVDREAIERGDFPVGRRGYDQAAVDEHLRRVADEIEALRHRAAPAAPLSAGASEQVRAILEAAETGAAQLRAEAGREAGDHVARVQRAAAGMLARLDELEGELNQLLDTLRRSGDQLTDALATLQRRVGELGAAPPGEPAAPDAESRAAAAGAAEPASADQDAAGEAVRSLNGDEAGARLIALNMALSGSPREETARYLAAHYALADAEGLLDDVYSRAAL